jgi:hypothetical protein
MMFDADDPFWFASTELLNHLFRAEINALTQLLAKYTDLLNLLDTPQVTVPQRMTCFALLAHRKLIETINDTLAGRYEEPAPLTDVESDTINRTHGLVPPDSPVWVLEMHEVVERLPVYIYDSLPEPLRKGGFGFNRDDTEQMQEIQSARETLNSIEQIQVLIERVLDQQLQRLQGRWSAGIPTFPAEQVVVTKANRPKGFEGLPSKKLNLSRYMENLTEKQWMAFSLKNEFGLGLAEIAWRMELDRKTAYEHIQAANRKIDQDRSWEKRRTKRGKTSPEE